jgi:hypothetical protein
MATVLTIRPGVSVRPGVTLLGKGPVIDLNPNLFPTLIPVSSDGYTLSQLGSPDAPATAYTIENGYIKYVVNGAGSGAIGNADSDSVVNGTNPTAGLQLDPTGQGNYGIDDFIDPGDPVEYFQFEINGGSWSIIGNNSGDNVNDTAINTWRPASNRVVVQTGSEAEGFVVMQYLTLPNEPVIRIKMSYTNTTGNSVTLKVARGLDPDQDSFSYNSSSTDNQRGLGTISGNNISYSLGPISGKAIAIFCPGDGYTHNTSIIGGVGDALYTYTIDRILNNVDDLGDPVPDNIPNSDIGIACAWDVGTVNAGATVDLYCYYVLGNHIENIASRLGSRSTTSLTISLADITLPNIFPGLGVYLGSGSWDINVPWTGNSPGSTVDAIEFNAMYPGVLAQWEAAWASAGYDTNYSYAWNATWASGQTGVVRLRLLPAAYTGQQIFIVPIDTTFPAWQTTTPDQVPAVQGVFTLPVTLTPYVPTTPLGNYGNWC